MMYGMYYILCDYFWFYNLPELFTLHFFCYDIKMYYWIIKSQYFNIFKFLLS